MKLGPLCLITAKQFGKQLVKCKCISFKGDQCPEEFWQDLLVLKWSSVTLTCISRGAVMRHCRA